MFTKWQARRRHILLMRIAADVIWANNLHPGTAQDYEELAQLLGGRVYSRWGESIETADALRYIIAALADRGTSTPSGLTDHPAAS
ncbi:hypothetical protein [Streptomyces sp. 8L]|uniref:hypothetical protein n=1 Tax=Streptomyces sp. 8L TaxID=2877242 RepID=UPI001CD25A30|nr:hypothetical protein [Streptomyces sp. 8L]MCA1221407.1 hypothetical protein [Streptomyces sp. 8L]